MTTIAVPPETVDDTDRFAHVGQTALFDIFYEAVTSLGASYISRSYKALDAGDTEQSSFWVDQVARLKRWVLTVDPDDRQEVMEAMETVERAEKLLEYASAPLGSAA